MQIRTETNSATQFQEYRHRREKRWSEILSQEIDDAGTYWYQRAIEHGGRCFLTQAETGKQLTYEQFALSALVAAQNLTSLNTSRVAIYNDDSLHFVSVLAGCGIAGIEAVLLNTREKPRCLRRRLYQCGEPPLLGGPDSLSPQFALADLVSKKSRNVDFKTVRESTMHSLKRTFAFIFTSGTSGLPKAARFSHLRMLDAGIDWSLQTNMTANSTCYIPLPLYHGNGLAVALASVIEVGGRAIIRDRFSVSEFWSDVSEYGCTHSVYIGETWDYLLERQDEFPYGSLYPLTTFGNGLKKDKWRKLLDLGWADHIVEHYGATELPAEALLNSYGRIGSCGFLPPGHEESSDARLLTSDNRVVGPGHEGELLLRVREPEYRGFLEPRHSNGRILRDVCRTGDLWWRSGDKLKWGEDGFFTFLHRVGENLRYKGENLSHDELRGVAKALANVEDAYFSVVNDRQSKELVALVQPVSDDFQETDFIKSMANELPSYAVPTKVKIHREKLPVTTTLKIPAQSQIRKIIENV